MKFESILFAAAFLALAIMSWPSQQESKPTTIDPVEALYTNHAPTPPALTTEDVAQAVGA